jgi:arylsulfatase
MGCMSERRPNLLLITTDQQRWDTLGINGNSLIRTPNLDALAAGGVNFSKAYSTCPTCIAARRSILTGQNSFRHGLVGYQDGLEFNPPFTLPGLLKQAGYQTQLIGKLHMYPERKRYGFDNMIMSQQLDCRDDSPYAGHNDYARWLKEVKPDLEPAALGIGSNSRVARSFPWEEHYHQTNWLVRKAIEFLTETRDPSAPWFLHLSFAAPHPPLLPPAEYLNRYSGKNSWKPNISSWSSPEKEIRGLPVDTQAGPFSERDMKEVMAGYYGLINHIDDQIAYLWNRVFEKSYTRYADEPAWIIFTSDHGEMLGDHHLFRKSLPYEGSTHIPFFAASHRIPLKSHTCDELACLEDLLPTFLDFADVKCPNAVDGQSLVPDILRKKSYARKRLFGEHLNPYPHHYLIEGNYKYCWFANTQEEQVFDLDQDPYELNDISADRGILGKLRKAMATHLRGRKDYTYNLKKLKPLENKTPRVFRHGN